ncbi:hypothetical protein ACWA5Z_06455 [Testudinibacter sp. P80/BLE/0925]
MNNDQITYETNKFLGYFTTLALCAHLSPNRDKRVKQLAKKYRDHFKAKQLRRSFTALTKSERPADAVIVSARRFVNEMPFKAYFDSGRLRGKHGTIKPNLQKR